MEFLDIRLRAGIGQSKALGMFYVGDLGLRKTASTHDDSLLLRLGRAHLRFVEEASERPPFYHFALLLPGDRFDAAHEWLHDRATLLPDPETGDTIFDFRNWDAHACYVLDPAGNIVELIAHRGIGETGAKGSFSAHELIGFSEVGIVAEDKAATISLLENEAGLHVWDGDASDPGRLAFIGERGRVLIVAPPDRGWLPTGRSAQPHPLELFLEGPRAADITVPGSRQRIRVRPVSSSRTTGTDKGR